MIEQLFLAFGVFISIAVFFAFGYLSKLADKEREKRLKDAEDSPIPLLDEELPPTAEPEAPAPEPQQPKTEAEKELERELAKLLGK